MQITTIGIDLAKTVFQLHAVDTDGATVVRKRLRRAEVLSFVSGLAPCLIGMEACATSHFWARELAKCGHTVKLMPPSGFSSRSLGVQQRCRARRSHGPWGRCHPSEVSCLLTSKPFSSRSWCQ